MAHLSGSSPPISTDPKSLVSSDNLDLTEQEQSGDKRKSKSRHRLPAPALIALAILVLASAAGLVLSIVTSVGPRLQTEGDIPSRILLFAASVLSIVADCLYIVVLLHRKRTLKEIPTAHAKETRKTDSIRASVLIFSRLLLVTWIASVVLTSLLIAQPAGDGVAVFSPSAPLVDKAAYFYLLISGAALISSCVLSYYFERSRSPVKVALSIQRPAHDSRDTDLESLRSFGIRDTIYDGQPVISKTDTVSVVSDFVKRVSLSKTVTHPVDNLATDPRQKKLLFSYKPTTQLLDEYRLSVIGREAVSMAAPEDVNSLNIKRKPIKSSQVQPQKRQSPPSAASAFFLGHRIGGGDDRMSRMMPYSPAVTRPISVIPPMPAVPAVPSTESLPPLISKTSSIKRKPVGAPSPKSGPIKRKPVNAVSAAAAPSMHTIVAPISPSQEASLPEVLAELLPEPQPTAGRLSAILSSKERRKVSTASIVSTYSMPSPTSPPQSLVDMIVSSLRRDSSMVDPAPSPYTRSVTYAQPMVLEQPIIRKSFIASSGRFGLPDGVRGSRRNSRRPSGVSIMETIYSPAEEDEWEEQEEQPEQEEEEDTDLAAMIREEAAAAAVFANAGRFSNTPGSPAVPLPTSLSRTARKVFIKTTLKAMSSPRSPVYTSRSPSRPGYNFSRPIRTASRVSVSSRISSNFTYSTTAKPRNSAVLSPRSRVRRQLLQMLPEQHQPKPTAVSI
ncbi:hypothetical protein F503_06903 [Ophiostoma piceae UAMH 11346]|uniref:Uncharacterized protein n=1 Tax=Ophiostoma piceae (strain UAMH 11346) TaxID=1262450 RepID=S3C8G1_OPHP1|nr:hypothetical protein F503_06903 [Ophiostoma piceae UAMH 11346]